MKKMFHFLLQSNAGDLSAIVFLGDLFDGGRYLSDEQFEWEWNRFTNIFKLTRMLSTSHEKIFNLTIQNISTFFIAGNHVGMKQVNVDHTHVYSRFKKFFSTPHLNYRVTIGDNKYHESQSIELIAVNREVSHFSFENGASCHTCHGRNEKCERSDHWYI